LIFKSGAGYRRANRRIPLADKTSPLGRTP